MSCTIDPVCEETMASSARRQEVPVSCPHRPAVARRVRRSPLLVGLLLVTTALLGAAWQWRQEPVPVVEPLARTITAKDGHSELRVPARWTQRHVEPGDQAVLMAGSREDDMCVRVLSEPKAEFGPSLTLEQYGRLALEQMRERLVQCQVISGPTPLVVDGRRALRWELRGTAVSAGVTAVFLHTVVEGRRHYHQVTAVSLAARIDRNRGQLEAVAGSFREVR